MGTSRRSSQSAQTHCSEPSPQTLRGHQNKAIVVRCHDGFATVVSDRSAGVGMTSPPRRASENTKACLMVTRNVTFTNRVAFPGNWAFARSARGATSPAEPSAVRKLRTLPQRSIAPSIDHTRLTELFGKSPDHRSPLKSRIRCPRLARGHGDQTARRRLRLHRRS